MIAYNYCYSTCLGKVTGKKKKKFGVTDLEIPEGLFGLLGEERTFLAPNNVAYVKKDVRVGIFLFFSFLFSFLFFGDFFFHWCVQVGVLPRLLSEILETRFMVKKAMKGLSEGERGLKRVLNSPPNGVKNGCQCDVWVYWCIFFRANALYGCGG